MIDGENTTFSHLQFLADVSAPAPVLENSRNSLIRVSKAFQLSDGDDTDGLVVEHSQPSVRTTVVRSVS